jgi:chromosome segregation ATPase
MFKQNTLAWLIGLGCLIGGFQTMALAQAPAATNQAAEKNRELVKDLLNEVHQLRLAIQRNSVATYRAQVTLERLKLQQVRVDELLKEQTELRNGLKAFERNLTRMDGQIAELEKMLALAATPTERNEREMMIKDMKGEIENEKHKSQDWREREPQITARLQLEQAKLNELNDSLDKLERELENTAAEKGKRP